MKKQEPLTYKEVGKAVGMKPLMLARYTTYMQYRWKEQERTQCLSGYAQEWAERFKSGMEYSASDGAGRKLLDEIH